MARYTGPACKLCRREGKKLFLKGDRCYTGKCALERRSYAPGQHGQNRKKASEYGLQLRAKQSARRYYGLSESQFHKYFLMAERKDGVTGTNLLQLCESRLDNVVYRMRFATSRAQARQIVSHGHILVNGKRVDIPSYSVRPGDVIEVKESSKKMVCILDALNEVSKSGIMPWLTVDVDAQKGTFTAYPRREEVTDLADVKEQLVVEHYSK